MHNIQGLLTLNVRDCFHSHFVRERLSQLNYLIIEGELKLTLIMFTLLTFREKEIETETKRLFVKCLKSEILLISEIFKNILVCFLELMYDFQTFTSE